MATPETALVERLRHRDREAWAEIYQAYEGRLYGFAYRLSGNRHDAADLVQETFVRALPRLDRLDPRTLDLQAYLFATLKNLFLKGVERGKRQQPVEAVPEPDELPPIEDDPERSALLDGQQREVRVANGNLAPRQRVVLALRDLEDLSYAEIGELVGLKENAVAQLISRARLRLREELRLVQVDRSKLSDECQANLLALAQHLDGELKGPKRVEVLAHLDGCADCRAALEEMGEAQRRYRALIPPVLALVDLFQRVDDALAANGYWDGPRRWQRSRATAAATLAVAVVIAALGAGTAYVATRDSRPAVQALSTVAPTRPAATRPSPTPRTTRTARPSTTRRVVTTVRASSAVTTVPGAPPPPPPTATAPSPATTTQPPPTATLAPDPAATTTSKPPAVTVVTTAPQPVTVSMPTPTLPPVTTIATPPPPTATIAPPPVTSAPPVTTTTAPPPTTTAPPPVTTIAPPPPPDLVISGLSGTSVTVANVGTGAAGPFVVTVGNAGTFSFGGLAAGTSSTRTFRTCLEGTIAAVADAYRQLVESNEGNNTRSIVNVC